MMLFPHELETDDGSARAERRMERELAECIYEYVPRVVLYGASG